MDTGIWDNAWWNSANALTALVEFAMLRPEQAKRARVHDVIHNTFVRAQRAAGQTTKHIDADSGMMRTDDCIGLGCVSRRGVASHRRGFDDFLNDYYDDEGWWALALIRSHDLTGRREYLEAAVTIFQDMKTGLGGPCDGGIFWSKERKYVSAISNELYLSVAAYLANRLPKDPSYLATARGQWKWFKQSGLINGDGLVNDGLDDRCRNNGLQTWTYNQGVVLGGLAELYRATGDAGYLAEAGAIARAALAAFTNARGVVIEADGCETRPGRCGRDGQQFKGILMRNLRYLHDAAPDPAYRASLLANADAIWERDRKGRATLGPAWDGPFFGASGMTQSAALDVLVGAIAVA